jgi:hypothetical protein
MIAASSGLSLAAAASNPLRHFPARAVIWIIRRTRVRTSSVRPAVRPLAGTRAVPRPSGSAAVARQRDQRPVRWFGIGHDTSLLSRLLC